MDAVPTCLVIEKRSRARIKEDRYLNEPIKIGETDPGFGDRERQARSSSRRNIRRWISLMEMTGRRLLARIDCYVRPATWSRDTVNRVTLSVRCRMAHQSPIRLNLHWFELNAVIAWLQAKDTPGDYIAGITVPMPGSEQELPVYEVLDV